MGRAAIVMLLLWAACACAADEKTVEATDEVVRSGPDPASGLLARNGFAVTDEEFKQIFSAYVGGGDPYFVTTDSAWHAYHVLLEEGVKALEANQCWRLKRFSRRLLEVLKSPAGKARVDPVLIPYVAVGATLAGEDVEELLDAKDVEEVHRVVKMLQSGGGIVPYEIGFPLMSPAFRAQGFYAESPELSAYFVARKWYATVDFRRSNDREMDLARKLADAIRGDRELKRLYDQLTEPYARLLGPCEDADVHLYVTVRMLTDMSSPTGENLPCVIVESDGRWRSENLRELVGDFFPVPRVNDQWLPPEQYADFPEVIRGFRLMPSRRLPSAVCLQNAVDPKVPKRQIPSGLDFTAACEVLRSPAAERALKASAGEADAKRIAAADCGEIPTSLHGRALRLLARLQEPLPESAPPALRTDAWGDKQLATQLAAWAQQRHTWALQAKISLPAVCGVDFSEGYVSPYPRFYDELGALARDTALALRTAGVGRLLEPRQAALEILKGIALAREYIELERELNAIPHGEEEKRNAASKWLYDEFVPDHAPLLNRLIPVLGMMPADTDRCRAALDALQATAERVLAGKNPSAEDRLKLERFAGSDDSINQRLEVLSLACRRLAEISRKELAGEALDGADGSFVRNWGPLLAHLQGYYGNSYVTPRDDFSVVVPVFISPEGNASRTLYVGVARPRAIYVIIPVKDKLVRHRGAVLSYREFTLPVNQSFGDADWRKRIADGKTPPPPAFTRSLTETRKK